MRFFLQSLGAPMNIIPSAQAVLIILYLVVIMTVWLTRVLAYNNDRTPIDVSSWAKNEFFVMVLLYI